MGIGSMGSGTVTSKGGCYLTGLVLSSHGRALPSHQGSSWGVKMHSGRQCKLLHWEPLPHSQAVILKGNKGSWVFEFLESGSGERLSPASAWHQCNCKLTYCMCEALWRNSIKSEYTHCKEERGGTRETFESIILHIPCLSEWVGTAVPNPFATMELQLCKEVWERVTRCMWASCTLCGFVQPICAKVSLCVCSVPFTIIFITRILGFLSTFSSPATDCHSPISCSPQLELFASQAGVI